MIMRLPFSEFTNNFVIIASINLVSISIFSYAIYYLKYKNTDSFVSYLLFNVFIFLIVYFLGHFEVSMTVGFAIFGLVGLVRLRSDTISRTDITYFIGSLTLAIINALTTQEFLAITIGVNIGILLLTYVVDIIRLGGTRYQTIGYTLDKIPPYIVSDKAKSCLLLSKELGAEVENYTIQNINTLKDSVKLTVVIRIMDAVGLAD